MSIRVVLFDLWGTLIVDDGAIAQQRRVARVHSTARAMASLGFEYEEAAIESAFERAAQEHARIHADALDIGTEARTILYLRHLDEGLAERLDDDAWRMMHEAILTQARTYRPPVMTGAREAVEAVRATGVAVGLISNAGITPGFVLREILDAYGIGPQMEHLVFSDEVELAKPAPAIFEHALELFGVEPAEAAFVGDQPVLDVLGPRSAGLWSIQVGDLTEDGIEPHVRIKSVASVMEGLRSVQEMAGVGDTLAGARQASSPEVR